MLEERFKIKSLGEHEIFVVSWKAENNPIKGIIHIVHGMAEHCIRYKAFAEALVEQGYAVYAHDHRGHGQSIKSDDDLGFFDDTEGWNTVVNDVHKVNEWIREKEPGKDIIIFGHSMGSFITRRYIQIYGSSVKAAIISGTGASKGLIGKVGLLTAKAICKRKGKRYRSKLLDNLSFGAFNKKFKPNRTHFDWLSRDTEQVDLYVNDKLCGFLCSAGFFVDLLTGIDMISSNNNIKKTPKELPLLMISGDMDPVGGYGKGVEKVYQKYKNLGYNITMMLFKGGRHELVNETNREEVYKFILNWVKTVF